MNLKERRKKAGLTQMEVANALGITDGAVCQWENGGIKPRADNLLKLAKLFDCTVDELLADDDGGE